MKIYKTHTLELTFAISACFFLLPKLAHAQDQCLSLSNNIDWNDGIQYLSHLIQENKFDEAVPISRNLQEICPRSPLLNYMQGRIAEGLNDDVNARLWFQKASEYTYEFAVSPETAQKIWYARYEKEHPERTGQSIDASNQILEETQNSLSDANHEISTLKLNIEKTKNEAYRKSKTLMWTGAGLGFGGLVLTGAGFGMVLNAEPCKFRANSNGDNWYSVTPAYISGWVVVASGLALTVTGAVLTGIFGYQYTHTKQDLTFSWSISPENATFNMSF